MSYYRTSLIPLRQLALLLAVTGTCKSESIANVSTTAGSCVSFGCKTSRIALQSCQCNVHCVVHSDCCDDYASTCSKQLEVLNHTQPEHVKAAHRPDHGVAEHGVVQASNSSEKVHPTHNVASGEYGGRQGHASRERDSNDGIKTPPSNTGKKSPETNGKESSRTPSAQSGKSDKKEAEKSSRGHHITAKHDASDAASAGKGDEHNKTGVSHTQSPKGGKHHEAPLHESATKPSHARGSVENQLSLRFILLACAAGLALPVSVALLLILRSRGHCGGVQPFHLVGKPPQTPTDGPLPQQLPTAAPPVDIDQQESEILGQSSHP